VETPEVSGYRFAVHFILFLLCLYFGFIKAPLQTQTASQSFDVTLFERPPQLVGDVAGSR
jgi:hypothetical protein